MGETWLGLQWFSDRDTPEDRKVITKLDLLILPFALVSYWTKYIDQANLSESLSRPVISPCIVGSVD